MGILLAILLLVGMGFSLWKDRGLAFSPGPVTGIQQQGVTLQGFSSHADFEKTCRYCHQPFQTTLGEMCLACHTEIASELTDPEGFHTQLQNAGRCHLCHSDHHGREFNPTLAALDFFDHDFARFSTVHHQENYDGTPIACSACHDQDDYGRVEDVICQDCHGEHDAIFMQQHIIDFGAACQDCHDGADRMSGFDHAQVFPLDGKHAEIECAACHANQRFAGTPKACAQCHAEPEVHAGLFGLECEACHTTAAWLPAVLLDHSFPLRHGLEDNDPATACATCHVTSYTEYTCYGCHEHQPDETARKHSEEGISAVELAACVECHPGGREAEEGDDD